jgi:hypothetical protein
VEPYCKVVFIGRLGDDVIDLIDDAGPMLNFGQFIHFLVHEELSNEGDFDEFGEGLDDRMGLVVVGKGWRAVLVEKGVIGGGFVFEGFELLEADFILDVAGEEDGGEAADDETESDEDGFEHE